MLPASFDCTKKPWFHWVWHEAVIANNICLINLISNSITHDHYQRDILNTDRHLYVFHAFLRYSLDDEKIKLESCSLIDSDFSIFLFIFSFATQPYSRFPPSSSSSFSRGKAQHHQQIIELCNISSKHQR